MSGNSELRKFLNDINDESKNVSSPEQLESILRKLHSFERNHPEFRYNHTWHWVIFALGFIASLQGIYESSKINFYGEEVLLYCSPILIPLIALYLIYRDKNLVSTISDRIFKLDILFDNKISSYKGDKDVLFNYLYNNFGDFDRGDEQRYLTSVYEGQFKGNNHSFNYKHYTYHYVEVYYVTVTTTDAKGNTRTRQERRTRTCYRYGLLLDFPFVNHVAIRGSSGGSYKYKKKWETSSNDFEDNFTTYCDNEMEATKFLKPAVILELLELDKELSEETLEFRDKQLCLSFSDSSLLNLERQHGIRNIKAFIQEIDNFNELKRLKKVFKHIDKISTYVDNNFKGEK